VPPARYPQPRRSSGIRLSRTQQHRFDSLKQLRDQRAAELGLDPTVIASKGDLIQLAGNSHNVAGQLMTWQRQLLAPLVEAAAA
jgi:ribonuclease D